MNHRVALSLSQTHRQKLIFTQSIGLALEFLQAPLDELEQSLYKHAEKNPFIEFHGFCKKSRNIPLVFDPPAPQSNYTNLRSQIEQSFSYKDKKFAYLLLKNLDDRGYLTSSLDILAQQMNISDLYAETLLGQFQRLTPLGVGSRDLREYLLIQLEDQGKQDTLSFELVRDHFSDLLHQRFTLLAKKLFLPPEEIKRDLYANVKQLYIHPFPQLNGLPTHYVKPEIILFENTEHLEDPLESLSFNKEYKQLAKSISDPEQRALLRKLEKEAVVIFSILKRRKATIQKIVSYLKEKQKDFLFLSGNLNAISIKEAAFELGIHDSTLLRALNNKYLECDRGIFPLRHFFSKAFIGTISRKRVAEEITKLIAEEDKNSPYSDEKLMELLKDKGLSISRRSVTKIRNELKIPSKKIRKSLF